MCCDAPDAPSPDPRQGEALIRQTQIAERMADYAIQSDQRNQLRLQDQDEMNRGLYSQYMRTAATAEGRADQQWQYYLNQGRPMIDSMFADARNWDSEAGLAAVRGQASADVEQAFAQQRQTLENNLRRAGVNPGSNRAIAAMAGNGAQAALAKVGAANQMTEQRRMQGIGLRQQAANVANGATATSLQQSSLGNSSLGGAGAVGASNIANGLNTSASTMNGLNSAANGFGNAAQGWNSMYGNQLQGWSAGQQAGAQSSAGLGSLVGTLGAAAIFASDRRVKEAISLLGQRRDGLNIYSFEYKPEFYTMFRVGPGSYVGFMADEVEKLYPNAVLTNEHGYKLVDYSKVGA
jgi:hypothetical protein